MSYSESRGFFDEPPMFPTFGPDIQGFACNPALITVGDALDSESLGSSGSGPGGGAAWQTRPSNKRTCRAFLVSPWAAQSQGSEHSGTMKGNAR
jgi:hypothetical protein